MRFLYHRVPPEMFGDVLYPLNDLKNIYPEAYKFQNEKYKGREEFLKSRIPPLNCLWNEVLHFTAVHPHRLAEAMVEARLYTEHLKFFEINLASFDKSLATVFKSRKTFSLTEDIEYAKFHRLLLFRYSRISSKTIKYFKRKAEYGLCPSLFHQVPNILYKGTISIKNARIIDLADYAP